MPDISVILPVYNGTSYLEASYTSVLQQTYKNFEFLILDDCSTDDSWNKLLSIKDSRVKLFKNHCNKGLFKNLNYLIRQSSAPLIKLWAQDDIMLPESLQQIIQFHNDHPEIGFSYTERDYMHEDSIRFSLDHYDTTPPIINKELHARIAFYTGSIAANISTVTLNKNAVEAVGLFNEEMKISGDFEMYVRLSKEYPIGFIRQKLVLIREHKQQLSQQEMYYIDLLKEDIIAYNFLFGYINKKQIKEGKYVLRNKKLLYYYTLMIKMLFKGKIKLFYSFLKTLSSFDNIWLITLYFIRNRILFPKKYRQYPI